MKINYTHWVHEGFELGILLKGINAFLEIIGGALIWLMSPGTLNHLITTLTQGELSHDPHDFFANYLLKLSADFSAGGQLFGSLFLLSHGVVKLFLVIALYKKRLWAYPVAIVVFGAFIAYQLYRYDISHSGWLLVLSVLDILVIYLTVLEYKNLKKSVV